MLVEVMYGERDLIEAERQTWYAYRTHLEGLEVGDIVLVGIPTGDLKATVVQIGSDYDGRVDTIKGLYCKAAERRVPFAAGDIVICQNAKDGAHFLVKGQTYRVVEVRRDATCTWVVLEGMARKWEAFRCRTDP